MPALSADILTLLRETRASYGPEAVQLQVALLHHAIQADSLLTAGVRVRGVEIHDTHQYLAFLVETGIVFNSLSMDRGQRVSHLWSGIVVPVLQRVETWNVPAEGVAFDLTYFYRSYADSAELEETVLGNPGKAERVAVYLRRADIDAFRRQEINATTLFSRSSARIDGAPFSGSIHTAPSP